MCGFVLNCGVNRCAIMGATRQVVAQPGCHIEENGDLSDLAQKPQYRFASPWRRLVACLLAEQQMEVELEG